MVTMRLISFSFRIVCATFLLCNPSSSSVSFGDDIEPIMESIIQARCQLVNFKASVEFKLLDGELLKNMPSHYQYDYWSDDLGQRTRFHQIPLSHVDADASSLWSKRSMMTVDGLWYFSDRPTELCVRRVYNDRIHTRAFSVYAMGLQALPDSDWFVDEIRKFEGILGLNQNGRYSFGERQTVDSASIQKVHWTDAAGIERVIWVEIENLRLHKIEVRLPLFAQDTGPDDVATTTISSFFDEENSSVIPNDVVVEYVLNDRVIVKFNLHLKEFEQDCKFTDEDFSFNNLGLQINATVTDQDAGKFLGYWNGRDWKSKAPIEHAPEADIIRKENVRLTESPVSYWPVSLVLVSIVSLLSVGASWIYFRRPSNN